MVYVSRTVGGWSSDLFVAGCDNSQNLSTSELHVRRFKHQEFSPLETCVFSCADGAELSNSSIFLDLFSPAEGNIMQDEYEKVMSGDFIHLHREVAQQKKHGPASTTPPSSR